ERTAIEKLRRGTRPSVIAIDDRILEGPEASICTYVRGRWEQDALPLLMLVEKAREGDIATWLSSGMNDVLLRPFADGELVARVSSLVRVQRLHEQLWQVRSGRELEESTKRFRVLAELVPHPMWMSDTDGRVQYVNHRWTEYTGGIIGYL